MGCIHEIEDGVGRIRFMGIDDGHQKHGIGQAIVRNLEEYAVAQGWNSIRLWARETAITFYENLNYNIIGDGYTIFGVIHHKIMEKII